MKKRKRKTQAKFIFRRIFITVFLLGLVGGGGYLAYAKFLVDEPAAATQASVDNLPENGQEPSSSVNQMAVLKVEAASVAPLKAASESEPSEAASEPSSQVSSSSESEPSSDPEESSESQVESSSQAESKPESKAPVSESDWELLLVNYANPLPEGYVPELETITDIYRVDVRIADNVKRMFNDARQAGINLTICSAYRSVDKQTSLFEAKKQEFTNQGKSDSEAVAAAATIVAKPGTSEHHTGLALDIVTPSYMSLDSGFANTPAFKWLDENAHKYGFVLRFPIDKQDITKIIYEPWHYRYVGEYNASVMKRKGLCLEEYVGAIKQAKAKALAEAKEADKDGSEEPENSETQS